MAFYRPIHKGIITQKMGEPSKWYKAGFHDGTDFVPSDDLGWKCNIRASQNGFVYKVMDNGGNPEIPNVLYTIETDGKDYIAHSYLHCHKLLKQKNDTFTVGEVIAKEGNTGKVFSGGRWIVGLDRNDGDGHHLHDRIQFVEPVFEILYPQEEYLTEEYDGKLYKDKEGRYWHIKNYNEHVKGLDIKSNGCIEPYDLYSKSLSAFDVWKISQEISRLKSLLATFIKN